VGGIPRGGLVDRKQRSHIRAAVPTSLTRMARLAEIQVNRAVGQLSYVDGKCTEPPEAESAELAVFAVSQMADMAKEV
jgi:hypothetical protein